MLNQLQVMQCENSMKNEYAKFQAAYENFCKAKVAHMRNLKGEYRFFWSNKHNFYVCYQHFIWKNLSKWNAHVTFYGLSIVPNIWIPRYAVVCMYQEVKGGNINCITGHKVEYRACHFVLYDFVSAVQFPWWGTWTSVHCHFDY